MQHFTHRFRIFVYRTARLLSKYMLRKLLKDLSGRKKQLLRKGTHLTQKHIF